MQIIQSIRDKGAAITITVIALALIAFILMDAKSGSNNMSGRSTTSSIGTVNGSSINKDEFEKRVTLQEGQREQQSRRKMSNTEKSDLKFQLWDQMVNEEIMYSEADKLGIDLGSKEFSAILGYNDQDNPILQQIIDPVTKQIDESKKDQMITIIKKPKPEQKDAVDAEVVNPTRLSNVSSKYMALLTASAYYPSWMEEKDNKENAAFAVASYVEVPYSSINDSTVKFTDEDVAKYIQEHKSQFKQEAGRTISYLSFSQLPSAADSAFAKGQVEAYKNEFATTTNVKTFIIKNSPNFGYDSTYKPKSLLKTPFADSITKTPQGTVYGPFVENGSYLLSRVMGSKMMPDSAGARHILIGTVDPQSGQPLLEDSIAKKRADSIYNAIKGGASFAALVIQYSTDEGSKAKGGEYPSITPGQMVPEFNDFVFGKPVGTIGVVKTQFGYHIIEVQKQKGSSPAYQIAFAGKEIVSSDATITDANKAALEASSKKDPKDMEAYLKKTNLKKITVPQIIKENDYKVGGLEDAGSLISWAFGAKKGEVSEPFLIDNQFVVATVDRIYEKGTMDVEAAKTAPGSLAINGVREQKKAEEIIKKMGANPTLESVAAAFNVPQAVAGADSSLTFVNNTAKELGSTAEPKFIGTVFNKESQTKVSAPIKGNTGVFVIKVTAIGNKPADTPEAAAAAKAGRISALRSVAMNSWFNELKDKATVKDERNGR